MRIAEAGEQVAAAGNGRCSIYKSGYFPKVLGILFIAAVAEITFPIWLLVKGVNRDRWQNRTPALETI